CPRPQVVECGIREPVPVVAPEHGRVGVGQPVAGVVAAVHAAARWCGRPTSKSPPCEQMVLPASEKQGARRSTDLFSCLRGCGENAASTDDRELICGQGSPLP